MLNAENKEGRTWEGRGLLPKAPVSADYGSLEQANPMVVNPLVNGEMKEQGLETFERKSFKFWIPRSHISHVTRVIRQHLPVHRRGVIHSVYLDTKDKHLYAERLVGNDGAILPRVRWYGEERVFLELKTHHEQSASLNVISADQAMKMLKQNPAWRQATAADDVPYEQMGEGGKTLAEKIAALIRDKKLDTVLRTEYYRTSNCIRRLVCR
jgi:SPX domain protein involved in polyphosphate accumulation